MNPRHFILGVDIGSVSVSLAAVRPDGGIAGAAYGFHGGNVPGALTRLLERHFDLSRIGAVAATACTPPDVAADRRFDERVAVITAAQRFHGRPGAVLIVGGERFGLIRFDRNGNYAGYKTNTLCAAGTGSFLDQQAGRLNLDGAGALSALARGNRETPPKMASRCSVFAKTDLVHAQQEGYSLAQICDGLCRGAAKNIVDTLFKGQTVVPPIVFTGGVSRNQAVVAHLKDLIRQDIVIDPDGVYGAAGAALCLARETGWEVGSRRLSPRDVVTPRSAPKTYHHPPLALTKSDYPDFSAHRQYVFTAEASGRTSEVEVDLYESARPGKAADVFLGADVGSTSTKAVLMSAEKRVLAGFYTRTAGKPVRAVQRLLAAMEDLSKQSDIHFSVLGAGVTGAGRKLAGRILGADVILDEITAHARAATEICPDAETIIEIGGQDAKFTRLKNGSVTFAAMNQVCAAGTGSFIEEQAQRLGVPLSECAARAMHCRAPMTSDRCTVFMERDVNDYLVKGYSADEVLAAVMHAVRENYLTKVAVRGDMGDNICFQGATAKNMALVAAFEQRLRKPIIVSRYAHLTGAYGMALLLHDQGVSVSSFRGIGLHRKQIPVTSEVCDFCANHCKITKAAVDGETVAYGFLCGRDYDARGYVNNNRTGFDLQRDRKKIFSAAAPSDAGPRREGKGLTIGLPAGLGVYEDLPFWKRFFSELSIRVITSEDCPDALQTGKLLTGAEFCAPMTAFHGHVRYLGERADYVFLPGYLENAAGEKDVRRQYCYYTQYADSLVSAAEAPERRARFLTPLINHIYSPLHAKFQLYKMLHALPSEKPGFFQVSAAYDAAARFVRECAQRLRRRCRDMTRQPDGRMHAVLLGRPYTVLSDKMNKGIPNIFASLGVLTVYQDMLSGDSGNGREIRDLLREVPWRYAADILRGAVTAAKTRGAYPVLITCFKCTPDVFVIEYFKKIMAAYDKPYLILQLDDHDSRLGYETRIEAAVRAFRRHHAATGEEAPGAPAGPIIIPTGMRRMRDKTLLIPNWDRLSLPLITAALRREGVDARLLDEQPAAVRKSLRHNTGQCIPMNIIAQEAADYIERHDLDPSRTLLWTIPSSLACNLSMFPAHIRHLFQTIGGGAEKVGVYVGDMTFMDVSVRMPLDTYFAYMFGGMLRKMGCRIRPYETRTGSADAAIARSITALTDAFSGGRSKTDALEETVSLFERIETVPAQRPKVAIFGDLYARDNPVMNQDLIRFIESHGGEAVTTPYSWYVKMVSGQYLRKWFTEGRYMSVLSSKALIAGVTRIETRYGKYFERILKAPEPVFDDSPEKILSTYDIRMENTGESMDNILKIHYIKKHYPDVSLFVQTSPAFCCPSLVTEAMAGRIEAVTGVPVVSITYDGSGTDKNAVIIPYLKYIGARRPASASAPRPRVA